MFEHVVFFLVFLTKMRHHVLLYMMLFLVLSLLYREYQMKRAEQVHHDFFFPKKTANIKKKKNQLDRIYYINLDRRTDRKKHFLQQCQREKIDMDMVERFQAIDGETLQLKPEEEEMFARCDYRNSRHRKAIMGNQLSHYYILLDMLEKGYDYILVVQDDVVLRPNFTRYLEQVLDALPEDSEIVNIGMHKFGCYQYFLPLDLEDPVDSVMSCKRNLNHAICELGYFKNPCSLAYIVTRKGANNLTEHFRKNGFLRATDCNYNVYLQQKKIHYASTIVLCTGALMGSDIFG